MANTRNIALNVLLKIENEGAYSNIALNNAIKENRLSGVDTKELSTPERRFSFMALFKAIFEYAPSFSILSSTFSAILRVFAILISKINYLLRLFAIIINLKSCIIAVRAAATYVIAAA